MIHENIIAIFDQLIEGRLAREKIAKDSVITELGIDSLAMGQIVLGLERKLGISIPDGELIEVVTVEDLLRIVERHLGGAGPLDGPAE